MDVDIDEAISQDDCVLLITAHKAFDYHLIACHAK
jgi:hypothetical protein